jgi:hypothetical protein
MRLSAGIFVSAMMKELRSITLSHERMYSGEIAWQIRMFVSPAYGAIRGCP